MADKIEQILHNFKVTKEKLIHEIGKRIIGQEEVVDQILACIFAKGHCLMVGVPGLAKTYTVNTISKVLALTFKRIQFTPDLMPSDITGTNVIDENDQGHREFRFVPGPLFAHIVLADEINRTPPKTQAALLECMQERQITVGKTTYPLPKPCFVIATQNPIEQEGTYPLPEAQLDRFMFNIIVDYPKKNDEEKIVEATTGGVEAELSPILSGRDIINMQQLVQKVAVSKYVIQYAVSLVRATRPKEADAPAFVKEMVDWGAGPRAGQYLVMGAKSMAVMSGRFAASCEDVRQVAVPVLRHRMAVNFAAQAEGIDSVAVVQRMLKEIPEPEVQKYS